MEDLKGWLVCIGCPVLTSSHPRALTLSHHHTITPSHCHTLTEEGEEEAEPVDNTSWAGSDRDYTYDEVVQHVCVYMCMYMYCCKIAFLWMAVYREPCPWLLKNFFMDRFQSEKLSRDN